MRKTALPTDRLSETARQKLSRFEAWLLRNGKSYQTIRSYLYTARHFLSLYPEVTHDNLQGPYGPPSTETISGKCDQPGRL